MSSSDMPPSPQSLLNTLRAFIASDAQFQIINSFRATPRHPAATHLKNLHVLDSSFNPLPLHTSNADKPAKPAAFEQRLSMMCLFAQDLQRAVSIERDGRQTGDDGSIEVDIGVTKLPIFVDKVKEIANHDEYRGDDQVEQVHLIGFDTLVRLLDTRYYPPDHTLKPLEALFGKHRVRVTRRLDDKWGDRAEQDGYIEAIAQGQRDHEGGSKDWAEKIQLVEGRKEGEEAVSSTKVREAVGNGDKRALQRLVTGSVANWILDHGLYKSNAPEGKDS